MKSRLQLLFGVLVFAGTCSLGLSAELPKSFWVSENVKVSTPKQIFVDSFSLDFASEQIDKKGREYYLLKTSLPQDLQDAMKRSLMKIGASHLLWNKLPVENSWIIKGNITYISDSISEDKAWRFVSKRLNSTLGVKRIQAEVFVYDTNISKDHYVIRFETGKDSENRLSVEDTADYITEVLQSHLRTSK